MINDFGSSLESDPFDIVFIGPTDNQSQVPDRPNIVEATYDVLNKIFYIKWEGNLNLIKLI